MYKSPESEKQGLVQRQANGNGSGDKQANKGLQSGKIGSKIGQKQSLKNIEDSIIFPEEMISLSKLPSLGHTRMFKKGSTNKVDHENAEEIAQKPENKRLVRPRRE